VITTLNHLCSINSF